jgi:hypothetical protein
MSQPLSDTPEFAAAVAQRRETAGCFPALRVFLACYTLELRRTLNRLKGNP